MSQSDNIAQHLQKSFAVFFHFFDLLSCCLYPTLVHIPVNSLDFVGRLPISAGDSRFRGFLPITRPQQKISRYHDLAQNFFNLKINQFFEKLINFVCETFFSERERIRFD